jgi:hypothetical protein
VKATIAAGAAILLLLVAAGGVWHLHNQRDAVAVEAPRQTMQQSGKILGLAIGDPIEQARATLDPLRAPTDHTPDAKEKTGRRIYWKLRETEFDWVMVWGNPQGRITRIRAYYRAEQRPQFSDVGDLSHADSVTEYEAKWTLRRPGAPYSRLVAQGANQQVQSVFAFSLELPATQQDSPASLPREEED